MSVEVRRRLRSSSVVEPHTRLGVADIKRLGGIIITARKLGIAGVRIASLPSRHFSAAESPKLTFSSGTDETTRDSIDSRSRGRAMSSDSRSDIRTASCYLDELRIVLRRLPDLIR